MGLLDDAIREHLELKRKHGADPDEVARQEHEALGASRRQAEFATPDEDEPASDKADEEPLAEAAEPLDAGDEREPFDVEALEPVEAEPQAPEPGVPAGAPGYDEDPWLEEERDEVPADEALDRPREMAEEKGEDVLEDTPDFLQETPEHERLWFEQKPPRNFDWDK
jgi:hypothetical protein